MKREIVNVLLVLVPLAVFLLAPGEWWFRILLAVLTIPLGAVLTFLYFQLRGTYVMGQMVRTHQRKQAQDQHALDGLAALNAAREAGQEWLYAKPFDPINEPALLAEQRVLRESLRDRLAIHARGPYFEQWVLTQKGRDELAAGRLAGLDAVATALEVALCGSLAAALAARRRQQVIDRAKLVGECVIDHSQMLEMAGRAYAEPAYYDGYRFQQRGDRFVFWDRNGLTALHGNLEGAVAHMPWAGDPGLRERLVPVLKVELAEALLRAGATPQEAVSEVDAAIGPPNLAMMRLGQAEGRPIAEQWWARYETMAAARRPAMANQEGQP